MANVWAEPKGSAWRQNLGTLCSRDRDSSAMEQLPAHHGAHISSWHVPKKAESLKPRKNISQDFRKLPSLLSWLFSSFYTEIHCMPCPHCQ